MFLHPVYFLFVGPALLLAAWAQWRVKSTFARYSQIPASRRLSGAQAASAVLQGNGIHDVSIEMSQGFLTDHYNPTKKTLRLSPGVYQGASLASVGVAAHEAGHALQHNHGYALLGLRSALVPTAGLGSSLAFPIFIIGIFMNHMGLVKAAILLFSATVAFQVLTLPVEFNASRRAVAELQRCGIVSPEEMKGVRTVLNAAAMTYVAAALSAIMTLLYFLFRAGLLGGRDE